jgi:hypothetical protein
MTQFINGLPTLKTSPMHPVGMNIMKPAEIPVMTASPTRIFH